MLIVTAVWQHSDDDYTHEQVNALMFVFEYNVAKHVHMNVYLWVIIEKCNSNIT